MTTCGVLGTGNIRSGDLNYSTGARRYLSLGPNVVVKTNGNANSRRTSTSFNMVAYCPFASFC